MDRFEKGMLVRSKAGHDTGEIFVITGTEDAYVYLADGRLRTLQKPKKKKKKHVQIILCRNWQSSLILRNIRNRWENICCLGTVLDGLCPGDW